VTATESTPGTRSCTAVRGRRRWTGRDESFRDDRLTLEVDGRSKSIHLSRVQQMVVLAPTTEEDEPTRQS
jgi:hypothetical protein